jgi:hypothetical protein
MAVGDSAPRIIAEICDYPQMIAAMRLRAQQRQIALGGEHVAHVAGLPRGYLQKLIGPQQKTRENVRRIGIISLGPVLTVLGVKLVMVEDLEAIKRYGDKIPKRDPRAVRSGTLDFSLSRNFMRKIQRKGGLARWQNKTPAQRSAWARRMNNIRWHPTKSSRHEQPTQDTAAGA